MKAAWNLLQKITTIIVLASAMTAPTLAQNADAIEYKKISKLISSTYDQPHHKVETAPISIANDFAIADWVQGEKGGRALLRRSQGKWEIMVCGGDGLKDLNALGNAGINKATAQALVTQLNTAEKSLTAERVKRFGLFGTTIDDHHAGQKTPNSHP